MSLQINLYNPALLPRRQHFSLMAMVQGWGLILAGVLFYYIYSYLQLGQLNRLAEQDARHFAAAQAQFARYAAEFPAQQSQRELQDEVRRLEQQVAQQGALIASLKSGPADRGAGYAEYMRAFARQVVPGLWLTGFRIDAEGTRITLNGAVTQPELLPQFIRRLGREPSMQGKTFADLQMQQPEVTAGEVAPRYVEFVLSSARSGKETR